MHEKKTDIRNDIIGEVHYYQPWDFTNTTEYTWTGYDRDVEEVVDNDISYIGEAFSTRGIDKTGIPAIIGEFSAENKNNTADRIKWFARVIKDAKSWGMTCFIWDNGDPDIMGFVDRTGDDDPFPDIVEACVKAATD